MKNDTRQADDIERDIIDEREKLSNTMNDLQQKFSVDSIVNDIGSMVRDQGGEVGRVISQTVGRNPAAAALVGVGLAWLFLGQDRNRSFEGDTDNWNGGSGAGHRRSGQGRRNPRTGVMGRVANGLSEDLDSYWYGADETSGDRRQQRSHHVARGGSNRSGDATGIVGTVRNAAGTVGDAMSDAADKVGQTATDLSDRVGQAASSLTGKVGHEASNLTDRLSHGLEDLSEEARARVLAARRAAEDARQASMAAMRKGARKASGFFEDQPLVVGALAVALGAAIGGALPHTRIEDETMGDSSDRLFAEAQALYREERDKALATAKSVASDVKGEIQSAGSELADLLPEGKNVGDVIVDRAADATLRVVDHAMGDTRHQAQDRSDS